MGEHRQGDVGVPGSPGADLVVVQAGFVLGLLEAFFDAPACSGGPGEVGQAGPAGAVADVVGDLGRVGDGAAGQQPVPSTTGPADPDRDARPVVLTRAVGSGAGRDPSPRPRRQPGNQVIGAGLPAFGR